MTGSAWLGVRRTSRQSCRCFLRFVKKSSGEKTKFPAGAGSLGKTSGELRGGRREVFLSRARRGASFFRKIGIPIRILVGSVDHAAAPTWRANCRCFENRGVSRTGNKFGCCASLTRTVMQDGHKVYPGSGKGRPYVQRGERICIILHRSACVGDTSMSREGVSPKSPYSGEA
jgi:hypothetical protein